MLQFYYTFIDKYIDRSDFEVCRMDTGSKYIAFSEDSIEKLIKPHLRQEYEKDKYNFLPRDSEELHPPILLLVDILSSKAWAYVLIKSKKKNRAEVSVKTIEEFKNEVGIINGLEGDHEWIRGRS